MIGTRHVLAALATALVALCFATPAALAGTPSQAHSQPQAAQADAAAARPAQVPSDRPILLIGAAGLAWSDVQTDPTLSRMLSGTEPITAGSLVVRSTSSRACPVDGWLAISTGTRADGAVMPGVCLPPRDAAGGVVQQWDRYVARAAEGSFTAEPGLLGDTLAAAGRTSVAIGPGAGVALATSDGTVSNYQPRWDDTAAQVAAALPETDLVVLDLGNALLARHDRAVAVAEFAATIEGAIQAAAGSGSDPLVMISGISDDRGSPRLRLFAMLRTGTPSAELTSPSTRQPGYILATDQYATLLAYLGVPEPRSSAVGAAIQATTAPGNQLAAAAVDRELHADAQRPAIGGFFLGIVVLNVGVYAAVAVGLRRPGWAKALAARRKPTLRAVRLVTLTLATIPVASLLTDLLPWWRAPWPVLALLGGVAAWSALIVTIAVMGPWRRAPLGSAAVVAIVTAVVIAVDITTGARLQVSAVMGISPVVAGRFYGMNNTAFSFFTASTLIAATALANELVVRGRRVLAALTVASIGVVAIVVDGAPFWGADFGGPPALLASFGILTLLAAGIRLTVKRVLLVLTGAGLVTFGIAFLDWLRPPGSRTHLGRFVGDVFDGGLWPIVARKLDQNLSILLGNRPLTILAICGVALVVFVLIRPVRKTVTSADGGDFGWLSRGAPLSAMTGSVPMLAPGLIALATAAGLGFALNDSGIAIPALSVAIAVPLLLASAAAWMLTRPADRTQSGAGTDPPESSAGETGSSASTGSPTPEVSADSTVSAASDGGEDGRSG